MNGGEAHCAQSFHTVHFKKEQYCNVFSWNFVFALSNLLIIAISFLANCQHVIHSCLIYFFFLISTLVPLQWIAHTRFAYILEMHTNHCSLWQPVFLVLIVYFVALAVWRCQLYHYMDDTWNQFFIFSNKIFKFSQHFY